MSQISKSCRMVLRATEENYSRGSGVHRARGGAFPILNGPAMRGGASSLKRRYLKDVRDEEYLEKDNFRQRTTCARLEESTHLQCLRARKEVSLPGQNE